MPTLCCVVSVDANAFVYGPALEYNKRTARCQRIAKLTPRSCVWGVYIY